MKKLTLDDIIIKSQEQQLKEKILKDFKSIEEFADAIDLNEAVVNKILNDKKICSGKFKLKIKKVFNQGFKEIVKTEKEQVLSFAKHIFENVEIYDAFTDLYIFEKVEELCKKYKVKNGFVLMKRNIAMHYFYRKNIKEAIKIINNTIDETIGHKLCNYNSYFRIDLALMHFYELNYEKAMTILNNIKINSIKDNEFKDKVLFKYYYSLGVIYNNTLDFDRAKNMFEKALIFGNTKEKGRALMGIGLSYKRQSQFDMALEYYNESLNILKKHRGKLAIVHNNIAEIYRLKDNYEFAIENIKKALNLSVYSNPQSKFIIYRTFVEISTMSNESECAIEQLLKLLDETENKFIAKGFITKGIDIIIDIASKYEHIDILLKLKSIIIQYIENLNNHEYINELLKCLGRIVLSLYKLEYKEVNV